VIEASDDQILYSLITGGVQTNAAEQVAAGVLAMFNEDPGRQGDNLDDDQPSPADPYLQIDSFEEFKNQLPTKDCD
jgi:hypothetical protein